MLLTKVVQDSYSEKQWLMERRVAGKGGVRKAPTQGLDGISHREFFRKKFLKGEQRSREHISGEQLSTGYDCWLLTSPEKTILAYIKSLKMTLNSKKQADLKGPECLLSNGGREC